MKNLIHFLKLLISIELRNKNKFIAIFVYAIIIAFIFSLFLKDSPQNIWNINFWIIFTLNAINIATNLFNTISDKEIRFFYNSLSPVVYYITMLINLFFLITINNILLIVVFSLFSGVNLINYYFFITIISAAIAFASNLTLIGFIGVKAGGNIGIITILSLPTLIPIIAKSIELGTSIIEINELNNKSLIFLYITSMFFIAISLALFPTTWKN